ncbi:MAG: peptidylprolyl isomerase [Vicinamibacterales bacterium]
MLNVRWSAVAALALVTTVSSCRKPATDDKNPASGTRATQGQPTPPPVAEPAKAVPEQLPEVLARVNGENVTKADFDKLITQMEMSAGQPVPKERRDEIYRSALDQLVTYTLLSQETRARGIKPDDKQVDQQMQQIRGKFKTEEEFTKALAGRGMTPERLRSDMSQEAGIKTMMDAEVAGVAPVTDTEIRDFYEKNPDKFKQPEGVRASHILIPVPQGADQAAKKAAKTKADSVLKKVKAGGDFAKLAREHSSDGSAQQGGDLGFFVPGQMVGPFDKAAFSMKPGEISDLVETQYGFHIIKVIEKKDASTVPLEQVTDRVREFLAGQRKQERGQAFINALKGKSKIEVLI